MRKKTITRKKIPRFSAKGCFLKPKPKARLNTIKVKLQILSTAL